MQKQNKPQAKQRPVIKTRNDNVLEISRRAERAIGVIIGMRLATSQVEIANKIGMTEARMSWLMSGKKPITLNSAMLLCKVYGINANWLLLGIGEPILSPEDEDRMIVINSKLDQILKKL